MSIRVMLVMSALSGVLLAQQPPMPEPSKTEPAQPPMSQPLPPETKPGLPAPEPKPAAPAAPVQYPTVIGGKDLEGWLKELRESPDGYVREMAVKVIPHFGPAARGPAMKPLIQQLGRETDPGVRVNILIVLGSIGFEKPEEARPMVDALNEIINKAAQSSPVRLHATRALASFGHLSAIAIPTLLRIVDDPAWETRQAVAVTLGRISRDPKKGPNIHTLNALTRRLTEEKSSAVRVEIAQSLLLLGPPIVPSAEYERAIKPYYDAVIKQIAQEKDGATTVWLLMTLMTYDGRAFNDTTITKIADFINQSDVTARVAALRALALLGDKAKPALPSMISALKWPEPNLVLEAIIALGAMRGAAKDAIPELERIKAGKDEYLKQIATDAVNLINGANAPPAPPPPPPPKK